MSVEEPENTVEPESTENDLYLECSGCQYDDPDIWVEECYVCSRRYPVICGYTDLYSKMPEMSYGSHKLLTRRSK